MKAIEQLRLEGGYREDRHCTRQMPYRPGGDPRPLVPLTGDAAGLWRSVVPALVEAGIVSELDSSELTALCEWWATYRQWADDHESNAYKRTIGMAAAYKQYRTLASKFGLTPMERSGLPHTPPEDDELAGLIA